MATTAKPSKPKAGKRGPQEKTGKDKATPRPGRARAGQSPGRPKNDGAPSGGLAKPGLGAMASPGRPKNDKAPSGGLAKPSSGALTSDQIFERLLVAIMEHRLPPGTQLVEQRLAVIFKVSRTKVREAIGRLVHDTIATNIPNRGAFVSSPTPAQAQDVFAARRLIEPALMRDAVRHATPSQVAALRAHVQREAQARAAGDQRQIVALSGEFHFLVADLAGNSFLARTLRELETLSALIIILFGTPHHDSCPGDHPALVDAIERGDAERAADLMLQHLRHVEASVQLSEPEQAPDTLEAIFA